MEVEKNHEGLRECFKGEEFGRGLCLLISGE